MAYVGVKLKAIPVMMEKTTGENVSKFVDSTNTMVFLLCLFT